MRMAATSSAIILTLVSAWVLYSESTATRRLEQQVQGAERQRERLADEIAVLKAEQAYLARPSRIETAARALGMRPAAERHYVDIDALAGDGAGAEATTLSAAQPMVELPGPGR